MKIYMIAVTTVDREDRDTILKAIEDCEEDGKTNDTFSVQMSSEEVDTD